MKKNPIISQEHIINTLNEDWDMGLRKIGTKAFWCPITFTEWLFTNAITNKPTNKMERAENAALITFVRSNAEYDNR